MKKAFRVLDKNENMNIYKNDEKNKNKNKSKCSVKEH